MTPEEAIAKLKTLPEDKQREVLAQLGPDERKGILAKLSAPAAPPAAPEFASWRDPLTRIEPHQPVHSVSDLGREVVRGVGNIGAGGLGVLLRPVATAEGVASAVAHPIDTATSLARQLKEHPLETIEQGVGQAGATAGVGEAAGGAIRAIPEATGGVARFLTKTTPRVTEDLAKETREGNETATAEAAKETEKQQAKHAEDVAKAETKRKVDLRKHFEKTQATKEANAEAEAPVARKSAINRGVERLDTEVRSDLEKVETKVHDEANQRYNDLRKVLKDEEAAPYQSVDEEGHPIGEPISQVEHLYNVASEPLRGTETETPIIKSLGKRTENAEGELTYNDLQGYREEVGRELRKGSLPPDVFTAYKGLMGAIDDAMGQIAERNGLKPQQDAARAYYRQYAETFLDRDAVARRALDSKERGGVAKAYQGKDQSGIQQIAKFDPKVAERLNNLRGYQAEAKALPSKPGKLKSLPKLEPKAPRPPAPEPVRPELKTVGPEEVRQAKLKSLQEKGVPGVRHVGHRIVNYGIGLHALWDAFSGRVQDLPRDIGLGVAGYGATEAFARLLERPDIQEMLTRPTAADLAKIPPDLRGNLGPMLDAAKAKGIKVDPRLYAIAAGAGPRKGVAAALRPTDQTPSGLTPTQ